LGYNCLRNEGWYPKPAPIFKVPDWLSYFTEIWWFKEYKLDITANNETSGKIYEAITNSIRSLKLFKLEKPSGSTKDSKNLPVSYSYEGGLVDSRLVQSKCGTIIKLEFYYHEKDGLELVNLRNWKTLESEEAIKQKKKLLDKLDKELSNIVKFIKRETLSLKEHSKKLSILKGKYNQNEIIRIEKYKDSKYLFC